MALRNNTFKKKAVKQPAGAPSPVIIQNIDVRPWDRREQDIPNWRKSLQAAEGRIPRRAMLYNLYADVILDGQVKAVTGKRKKAVTTANWQFVDKNKKPIEIINDIIDTIGFEEILEEVLNARLWGYTMLEPMFYKGVDGVWEVEANLIPRLNMRPESGIVAYDGNSMEGINIREGIYVKTIMEVGKTNDLGELLCAAPYQILKRGGMGDYAHFIQVFGNPIIQGVWDGLDENQRIKLLNAINNIGSGGAIVHPAGTEVNIIENKANASGDAHKNMLDWLNREISKALLGTTETTESSSSSGYAQAEIHQEQDEQTIESDLAFVRRILNSRFLPILQYAGFDTQGGKFIIQGEEQELTKIEMFAIHKGIATELGVPVSDEFWYETYGIPKPENYNELKQEKEENKPPANNPGEPDKQEEEPEEEETVTLTKTEKSIFRGIIKGLSSFFVSAPVVTTGATTITNCGCHHTIKLASEDLHDDDALIHEAWDKGGKLGFSETLYQHTANVLLKGFKSGFKKGNKINLAMDVGFAYGGDDPALLTAFEQNLFRFSGAKTLAEVKELNAMFRKAKSFDEFYRMAKKRLGVFNRDWLETEYNTALLTGEAAATYHRLIKQAKTFPYWEYKTVGDNRVRPEHAKLDGVVLPYNDPRWKKLYPPNGWNCRCYVVPRLRHEVKDVDISESRRRVDEYLESPRFEMEQAQGWGVNRAETREVFTANQQYASKFPGKSSKVLNDLGPADWNLESYSNAKKAGKVDMPEYDGTAKEFYEALERIENRRVLRDYNNRPLGMSDKDYSSHTTGARKGRVKYLTGMSDNLKNPDEVWLNGDDLDNMVFIKYYKDTTVVTVVNIGQGGGQVKTWFPLSEKRKILKKYRRGLLIKN